VLSFDAAVGGLAGVTGHTIDELLTVARTHLARVDAPAAARAAADEGALLVDIRPYEQRTRDGVIPGAILIDRNVLEWRLDPKSPNRIPETAYDRSIIIVCNEGYASSLAAATLQQLGLRRATDLEGGFQAWRGSGLPVDGP
jgi:rhodanese-related sulfurtransferase